MTHLLHDLRLSLRLLRRRPGFAAAALLTIALATGANTAVFSLVYSVVLRPLPFPAPDRLASITQFYPAFKETLVTAPTYFDWVDGASPSLDLAAYSLGSFTLTGGELAETVTAARVSHQFFRTLGVQPKIGRAFSADEDRPGAGGVALVSEDFLPRRDTLVLDGRPYRVIGVMPSSFAFPPGPRLWIPLALDPASQRSGGPVELVRVIGRLHSGGNAQSAVAALSAISARQKGFSAGGRPLLLPLRSWMTGKTEHVWFVLMGVAAFVLMIACANIAGLLIARAETRRGEMAIRMALGAPMRCLLRQLLVESLVLAAAGSAAGLLLAILLVRAATPLIPAAMLAGRPVQLDAPIFVFATCAALAISVLLGIAPARELLRTGRPRTRRLDLRSALVAAEVALSLVLLVTATLMVRSFEALTAVDPGFQPDGALTLTLNLPRAAFRDPEREYPFLENVLRDAAGLPGASDAALISSLPFSVGSARLALASAEGEAPWGSEESLRHRVEAVFISAGYFRTIGTPLVEGRDFSAGEMQASAQAVIVNQAFSHRYFGAAPAAGRRIKMGYIESPAPLLTIVGVARDSKRNALEEDAAPVVYRPYTRSNGMLAAGLIVRTAGAPAALTDPVRRAIAHLDRAVAVSDAQTLRQRLDRSTAPQELRSFSSALLALLALVMVMTGLYGLLSYVVAQRTVEIGVRMAIGAAPADVFGLVLRRGALLTLAGIAAGTLLSLAAGRSLRGLLFGVTPADPWTIATAAVLMLAISLAASAIPAWRATRTDPIRCLRQE